MKMKYDSGNSRRTKSNDTSISVIPRAKNGQASRYSRPRNKQLG